MVLFAACAGVPPPVDYAVFQAESPENLVPRWLPFAEELTPGLSLFACRTRRPRLEFWALRVDLDEPGLRVVSGGGAAPLPQGRSSSTYVSSFVRRNGLLAGLNANPFDPVPHGEGEDLSIVGIAVSQGMLLSPPNSRFDGLFFYDSGGAIVASQDRSGDPGIVCAVGGFHAVLRDGAVIRRQGDRGRRYPRSAAGLSADGRILYLLVIDGRRRGSRGATEAETGAILRSLGAASGLNLDGGGSSALALRRPDGSVKPVNKPIHQGIPGRERAVAVCLGIGVAP